MDSALVTSIDSRIVSFLGLGVEKKR